MSQEGPTSSTGVHARRAAAGDRSSLGWIVERFSPVLYANACRLLGERLRKLYDPADLVQEVWVVALPRFGTIEVPERTATPVLLRFLGTTLLYKVNNLIRKHIAGKPIEEALGSGPGNRAQTLDAESTGVVTRAIRRDQVDVVLAALGELEPRDQEVVLLRAVEQHSLGEIAALLGLTPNHVAVIWRRARERLIARLPDSIFAELSGDDEG